MAKSLTFYQPNLESILLSSDDNKLVQTWDSFVYFSILFQSRNVKPDIGISLIFLVIEDIKHYKSIEISIWLG